MKLTDKDFTALESLGAPLPMLTEWKQAQNRYKGHTALQLEKLRRSLPSDRRRSQVIKKGVQYAFEYALLCDRGPHNDTRKAVIVEDGYNYALVIDKCPRDDTRAAAIAQGKAYEYARYVDKGPREDTRRAAIAEGQGTRYSYDIDKYPTVEVFAWILQRDDLEMLKRYLHRFGKPATWPTRYQANYFRGSDSD